MYVLLQNWLDWRLFTPLKLQEDYRSPTHRMHSDHVAEESDVEVEVEVEVDADCDHQDDCSDFDDFFDFDHENLQAQAGAEDEAADDSAHDAPVKAGASGRDAISLAPPPPPSNLRPPSVQMMIDELLLDEDFRKECHRLRSRAKFRLAQYARAKGLEYHLDPNGDIVILPKPVQPTPQSMSLSQSSSSAAAQDSGSQPSSGHRPSISPHILWRHPWLSARGEKDQTRLNWHAWLMM